MVSVRKRGKVYEYRFEIASIDGKRYTYLRRLGITRRDAHVTANSRNEYYHVSATRVLQTAISKERLNKRGLVNSLDHYLKVHIITN